MDPQVLWTTIIIIVCFIGTTESFCVCPNPSSQTGIVPFSLSNNNIPKVNNKNTLSSKVILSANKSTSDKVKSGSYNDDAFGFIFITGGVLSKDLDFCGTFLVLSALAAIGTSVGVLKADERIPGIVAFATLLVSPFVISLRSGNGISPPIPIEILLCLISFIWSLIKFKQQQQDQ